MKALTIITRLLLPTAVIAGLMKLTAFHGDSSSVMKVHRDDQS